MTIVLLSYHINMIQYILHPQSYNINIWLVNVEFYINTLKSHLVFNQVTLITFNEQQKNIAQIIQTQTSLETQLSYL